jgi:F0F1-type ATP synthase delta subunit
MHNKVSRRAIARTVASKLLHEPSKRAYWLRATAAYLVEQRMVDDVDLLVTDIARELFGQSGHLFADVTSARKLPGTVRADLAKALKQATGAVRVELAEHTDPSLLGGLIARTPDAQLDASVRTKLKKLASL